MKFHEGKNPLQCSACNVIFETKNELTLHIETVHEMPDDEKAKGSQKYNSGVVLANSEVVFDVDDVRAPKNSETTSLYYDELLDESTGETKTVKKMEFRCTICNKTFTKKVGLKAHIFSMHQDKRCFECLICGKKYKLKGHLKVHKVLVHERANQKPFKCSACEAAFKTKHQLKIHGFKVHKEVFESDIEYQRYLEKVAERKKVAETMVYECTLCKKTFTKKYNLDMHMFCVHGNEKNFECSICGKRFNRKGNLGIHHKNKHGSQDRPFQCNNCDATFKQSPHLKQHMKKVHKEEEF